MSKNQKVQSEYDFQDDEFNYESDLKDDDSESYLATPSDTNVISSFFKTEDYLKNLEMGWKGYERVNGLYKKTGDEIAPDSFISTVINSLRSIIAPHSSISYTSKEAYNRILWEKFSAFVKLCVNTPKFNWDKFPTVCEDYDHALELFMSLSKEGWGQKSAVELQHGLSSEFRKEQEQKNKSFLDKTNSLLGFQKQQ